MPTLEHQVRSTVIENNPSVWEVSLRYEEGLIVAIKALPLTSLCLVTISRLLAELFSPFGYTIEVLYGWNPCRLQVLFGPGRQNE
jgi:hypothetical protein